MLGRYFKPYQLYKVTEDLILVVSSLAFKVFTSDLEYEIFLENSKGDPMFPDFKTYHFSRGSTIYGSEILDIFDNFASIDLSLLTNYFKSVFLFYR